MIADACNNVLTTGTSKLAVVYRPSEDVDADDLNYIPCQFCHGYFSRRQLWRHAEKCRCKPVGVESCLHPVASGDLLLPCKSDDSVAQLVSGIKKGPEFTVVNRDLGDATFGSKTLCPGLITASTMTITSILDCLFISDNFLQDAFSNWLASITSTPIVIDWLPDMQYVVYPSISVL